MLPGGKDCRDRLDRAGEATIFKADGFTGADEAAMIYELVKFSILSLESSNESTDCSSAVIILSLLAELRFLGYLGA